MYDFPVTEVSSSDGTKGDNFPAGIRILVVDDDELSLTVIQKVLTNCKYEVVGVNRATDALNILHERKGGFDLILADVHMPIMDGFELLDLVKKDYEIPVIMVSADSEMDLMVRGLQSGACSFCVKPVTKDYAETLWQFVFYNTHIHEQKLLEEEFGSIKQASKKDGVECSSSVNVRSTIEHDKRSKDEGKNYEEDEEEEDEEEEEEEDDEESDEENGGPKKSRMVWTASLHEKFVSAVKQIGIRKAVPRKILDIMNVRGVSRTHIASHLQKYRLSWNGSKESSQYGSRILDQNDPASYAPGLSQLCDQGSSDYSLSQGKYGQPSQAILSQRNMQRQVMSTTMDIDQQSLTSFPSVENFSIRDPVYQQGPTNFPSVENSGSRNLAGQQGITNLPSVENPGFRNLADQQGLTNLPSVETPAFRNLADQQGLTKLPLIENPGFCYPSYDVSSYKTNYVGLQLCDSGRMVGLGQTGFSGGATSHTMTSNNTSESHTGILFETPINIPNFDALNINQVTEVAPTSDLFVNPDNLQATATVPVAEPHQQEGEQLEGGGLVCLTELLMNRSTNDLTYLLSNVQNTQQEQGPEGLIVDPQFDVGELQFDDNYQP